MTIRLRQVLTVFLLLLFCLEHIANASVGNDSGNEGDHCVLSEQVEGLLSFDLVAEENETRDSKDDVGVDSLFSEGTTSVVINSALLTAKKNYCQAGSFVDSGTLPLYEFNCSLLI